jgi:hypothetical protein
MTPLKWAALALLLGTAGIHFYLALTSPEVTILFSLNALGYLALGGALLLPFSPLQGAAWLRTGLMAYTIVTILLYFVFSIGAGDWTLPWGPINKVIEVALLGVLWALKPAEQGMLEA